VPLAAQDRGERHSRGRQVRLAINVQSYGKLRGTGGRQQARIEVAAEGLPATMEALGIGGRDRSR
jgi:hypothetical protein